MNASSNADLTIANCEACDIDPDHFDHEAHVYIGWLYVREYELPEALAKFDAGLKRLVIKLGAEGKYHATVTWFFLFLISERCDADEPWDDFKWRNADIVEGSREVLSRYYSDAYLFSDRARERFLLPDKIPNPDLAA